VENKSNAKSHKGFLSRLRHDQSGNVIAILAVAIIPAIGIVGGAVDMSRIFIVRTSLQAACDAGSLMGRRVMGSGAWADNGGKANTKAEEMFVTNFEPGSYGTTNLVKTFSETNGKVTGRATVKVPMALMSVFGINEKPVAVNCDAEMRLPASDVMFVLDTTGSMNCPDVGTGCSNNGGVEATNAKIKGLRKASSCFYEALTKQNITGYDPEDCGETADPQGATSDTRLRFGFVPYSVNANVGRLLPHNYMADQWTYQSREPVFNTTTTTTNTPTTGNESGYTYSSQTTANLPDNNWTDLFTNVSHTNGQSYSYQYQRSSNGPCVSVPTETRTFTGTDYVFSHQTPDPLVHPATTITKYYTRTDGSARYMYQYRQYSTTTGKGKNAVTKYYCQLQYKTNQVQSITNTFTTTTPVTWTSNSTSNTSFSKWIYKPVTYNVGSLKGSSNSWKNSMTTNLGDNGSSKTINWNGCVEERQTARINDNDPSDNWNPIPTDALDMDIETAPTSDNATKWAPLLGGVIYNKYKVSNGSWGYTTDQYETSENRTYYPNGTSVTYNGSTYTATDTTEYCPTAAKLYSQMDATAFSTYLNGLVTGGNTYHDIGLLWGARLMAPEGIFKSVTADRSDWTERHMIFMTDGDTTANSTDYSAHGVHWWDRRQNSGTTGPTNEWLEANVDARTQALCRWIRNENITLWVVAFGQGISDATKTNLQSCATPGRYFEATNTADLIDDFKQIATTISALRLTN
jgi:hypothetical protein